jgi:predicted outer membrane protein
MCAVLGGSLVAQEFRDRDPAARPREGAAQRAPADTAVTKADQEMAACLLAACRNEIELAKLAQTKATSQEVKDFAAKTIRENTQGCEKLEKWAGSLASVRPAAGGQVRPLPGRPATEAVPDAPPATPRGEDPNIEVRVQPGARPVADVTVGGNRGLNWVVVHKELAAQCLASAKKELSQKEGADFDKCFIGMSVGAHQHAIDAQEVFAKHASPEFQAELQDCQKVCLGQLQEAKNIMKDLDGGTSRLSRRPQ